MEIKLSFEEFSSLALALLIERTQANARFDVANIRYEVFSQGISEYRQVAELPTHITIPLLKDN